MEGVLVSATQSRLEHHITVVTGAEGRYAFPASRLGPGRYTLAVRAVGYQLDPSRETKRDRNQPDPKPRIRKP